MSTDHLSDAWLDRAVRPEVRALTAYHLDQVPCRFKLDQNETPWDLPRRLKERVTERLLALDWSRYPDFHADALRRDLAELHGWSPDGVLVGNGSNELLGVALEVLAGPGQEVLGSLPGFGLYPVFVLRTGAVPRFLEPRPGLATPVEALRREIDRDPRRPLILCTPNNPTGEGLPVEVVDELAGRLEGPLLLDNAYGEFCRYDYRPLLERHPHLLLFKTFSKAWALGGVRLGYVLGRPELIRELLKLKLPYNLGHAGVVIGRTVLEEPAFVGCRTRAVVRLRRHWRALLEGFGLSVYPSEANFLLVDCGGVAEAQRIRDGLAERGILVRDVGKGPGLAGHLRFSVGERRALRATREALEEILDRPAEHPAEQPAEHPTTAEEPSPQNDREEAAP